MRTLLLPVYDRFVSSLDRPVPQAYVLDPGDSTAARVLTLHGIQVDTLGGSIRAKVETYIVDSTWTDAKEFQGHHARGVAGHWLTATESLAPGSYVVSTAQRRGLLAVYLLEPESDDGLAVWNLLDRGIAVGKPFPVRRVVGQPGPAPAAGRAGN